MANQNAQNNAQTNPQRNQNKPSDRILIRMVNGKIEINRYLLSFQVIIDGKDGTPKANTPYEVFALGKLVHSSDTNHNGIDEFEVELPYHPQQSELELMAKIVGSNTRSIEKIILPAPAKINAKLSITDSDSGYVVKITGVIEMKDGKPRPHCPINWSGNKQSGAVVSDANGEFTITDKETLRQQIHDELSYTLDIGIHSAKETLKAKVPERNTKQALWSQYLNFFPNWKYNRAEIIRHALRTISIFGTAIILSYFGNRYFEYFVCLLIGLTMYIKIDSDGKRGIIRPIVVTLVCLWAAQSLRFACTVVIISEIFFVSEELTRPVNPDTKEAKEKRFNLYPWAPMLMMFIWILIIWGHSSNETQTQTGIQISETARRVLEGNGGRMAAQQVIDSGFANPLFSLKNWFISLALLIAYSFPGEILSHLMPKADAGALASAGSFITGLKSFFQEALKYWKKR